MADLLIAHGIVITVHDVHTVIVDGRVVLEDRRATGVDENRVLDAAQRETELMIERLGLTSLLDTPETFWRHTRALDQARAPH